MSFPESEYLLASGVAGKSIIETVEAFLADNRRTSGEEFDPTTVARHLGLDAVEVKAVFEAYGVQGLLVGRSMVRCPSEACRSNTPGDEVAAACEAGRIPTCNGCETELLAGSELVTSYSLVHLPVLPPESAL